MNCGTEKGLLQHKARNEYPCKWCIKFRDDPAPTPKREASGANGCGTPNGWAKHRRDKTTPCEPCRLAYNADKRSKDRRRRGRTPFQGAIEHGTSRGYQQHISRGDPDCPPCRTAANEKRKLDRQAKKAANQ